MPRHDQPKDPASRPHVARWMPRRSTGARRRPRRHRRVRRRLGPAGHASCQNGATAPAADGCNTCTCINGVWVLHGKTLPEVEIERSSGPAEADGPTPPRWRVRTGPCSRLWATARASRREHRFRRAAERVPRLCCLPELRPRLGSGGLGNRVGIADDLALEIVRERHGMQLLARDAEGAIVGKADHTTPDRLETKDGLGVGRAAPGRSPSTPGFGRLKLRCNRSRARLGSSSA